MVVGERSWVSPPESVAEVREVWPTWAPWSEYLSNQSMSTVPLASITVLSSARERASPKLLFHER